jgi:hypothetical protein
MFKRVRKKNKGFALIMTLMILSVAMLTGLFMNSIILGEVRVSLNTANVVNSYYAAESGIERALYYLTTDKLDNSIDLYEGLSVTGNLYDDFGNNASYTYAATSIKAATFSANNVSNTNPAHVSIVNPRGDISSINWSTDTVISGLLKWRIDDCYPSYASDRMEITLYSFERLANNTINQITDKTVSVCDCAVDTDSCRPVSLAGLSKNKYYRFVFRPLDSEVNTLIFSLEPATNGIYSETLTQVKGKYKNSEYLLQAKMSALKPTSDIFSYVIFSEEELIKDL